MIHCPLGVLGRRRVMFWQAVQPLLMFGTLRKRRRAIGSTILAKGHFVRKKKQETSTSRMARWMLTVKTLYCEGGADVGLVTDLGFEAAEFMFDDGICGPKWVVDASGNRDDAFAAIKNGRFTYTCPRGFIVGRVTVRKS
ncbi:uncharacterized protein PV09_00206 [Verruconis gallopava]|uniref:Uncharacterized protein n=1 Tax=Verruconis gallopava TaxID=253628 RepID=A0A0D2BCY1_9PEZI|nr:uncharacterized protein PV09_00206 [Verruconis gallopava]KIW09289.1 hypothetical protein PV09_00206 [Verruconis gallopava]